MRFAKQLLGTILQFGQTFGVLEALGVNDAFNCVLLGTAVLADVFFGALVQGEILHETSIGRQHHT
ncbi:hypothetical protein D3C75_1294450 [compost metagenome]